MSIIIAIIVLIIIILITNASDDYKISQKYEAKILRNDTRREQHDFQFTNEMKKALDSIINKRDKLIFIHGGAGTGKTTFVKEIYKQLKPFAVCIAPTGIAALNIKGQTIHSFFKFKPGILNKDEITKSKKPQLFQRLKYLIIDEISMVRPDILDAIDIF